MKRVVKTIFNDLQAEAVVFYFKSWHFGRELTSVGLVHFNKIIGIRSGNSLVGTALDLLAVIEKNIFIFTNIPELRLLFWRFLGFFHVTVYRALPDGFRVHGLARCATRGYNNRVCAIGVGFELGLVCELQSILLKG